MARHAFLAGCVFAITLPASGYAAPTPAQAYAALQKAIQENTAKELAKLPADVAAQIKNTDPKIIQAAVTQATNNALQTSVGDIKNDAVGAINNLAGSNQVTNAAAGAAQAVLQNNITKAVNTAVLKTVGVTNIDAQVSATAKQLTSQLDAELTSKLGKGLSSLTADQRKLVDQYITGEAQNMVAGQIKSVTGILPSFDNQLKGITNGALNAVSPVINSEFVDALGLTADQISKLDIGGKISEISTLAGDAVFGQVSNTLSGLGVDLSSLTPGEIGSILSAQLPAGVTDLIKGIDFDALLKTPQILNAISTGVVQGITNIATGALGAVTGEITSAINGVASGITTAAADALSDLTSSFSLGGGVTDALSSLSPTLTDALSGISDYFPDDLMSALGSSYGDYIGALGSVVNIGIPILVEYDYTSTGDEDRRYTELCIDNVIDDVNTELGIGMELAGSRPQDCMPHKITRLFSALELSPWYLISLQDQAGLGKPYVGPIYRGEANLYRFANRMIQTQAIPNPETGEELDTAVNTCKTIINGTKNAPADPVAVRKELDSCVNQYILTRSDLPRIPSDDLGKKVDMQDKGKSFCQAFKLQPLNGTREMEYYPDYYYVAAWHKLLEDPSYLVRTGLAKGEPSYATLLAGDTIVDPIAVRDDYGKVNINDLTEFQYERIYDPSHPFAPRWDFTTNEVDAFSPIATASYGAPQNNVYCSGFPSEGIKTDLISWRYPGYAFYINWRIAFNAICLDSKYCRAAFGCSASEPCCAVNYEQQDKAPPIFCGPPSIEKLCAHITKPLVPVNVLKMREVNTDNFPQGVQKSYRFDTYFGKNRPYMRCWDTGLECGADGPEVDQESTVGSTYAIVGAGREGQTCMVGGGMGKTSSVVSGTADPIMDWMELKLYQVRGSRELGINCIPMHEKFFKAGSGEEMILSRTGAQFQIAWRELGTPDAAQNRLKTMNWPFSWRGYVTDPYAERFPFFMSGGGSVPLNVNLDQAEVGEVLIYDEDVVMNGIASQSGDQRANATTPPSTGVWRNPYVGFVTAIHNIKANGGSEPPDPDFIKSIAFNHGKYLDACANTEYWGQGEEYTIYKAELPPKNQGMIDNFAGNPKPTTSCEDPYMSFCIESQWTKIKRYTPYRDRRVKNIVSGASSGGAPTGGP